MQAEQNLLVPNHLKACLSKDPHQQHARGSLSLQVATLGKSGVSVGYYDTEDNAAKAYDRAAIGLLGRDNCSITTNFPLGDYDNEVVPQLIGKSREEVKTTLKNERAKVSSPHAWRLCCSECSYTHADCVC